MTKVKAEEPLESRDRDSRERIVEKALQLFARHGFAGTSISTLCKEVGLAPTAIYWHFGNKAGLLAAALELAATRWTDEITKSCMEVAEATDQLGRLLDGLRRLVVERAPEYSLIVACVIQHASDDPVLKKTIDRIQERSLSALIAGFERAAPVPGAQFEPVAEMVLGMLHLMMLDYLRSPDDDRLEVRLRNLRETAMVMTVLAIQKVGGDAPTLPEEPPSSDDHDSDGRHRTPPNEGAES